MPVMPQMIIEAYLSILKPITATEENYDSIESGTKYLDDKGKLRRKP